MHIADYYFSISVIVFTVAKINIWKQSLKHAVQVWSTLDAFKKGKPCFLAIMCYASASCDYLTVFLLCFCCSSFVPLALWDWITPPRHRCDVIQLAHAHILSHYSTNQKYTLAAVSRLTLLLFHSVLMNKVLLSNGVWTYNQTSTTKLDCSEWWNVCCSNFNRFKWDLNVYFQIPDVILPSGHWVAVLLITPALSLTLKLNHLYFFRQLLYISCH